MKLRFYFWLVIGACCSLLTGCYRYERMDFWTSSMEPTISPGDVLVVDRFAFTQAAPSRWDLVVFVAPIPQAHVFAMRVVGMPGETISFETEHILINGRVVSPPPGLSGVVYRPPPRSVAVIQTPYTVPTNSYFVIGDNTKIANDSRSWGAVPRGSIRGKIISVVRKANTAATNQNPRRETTQPKNPNL